MERVLVTGGAGFIASHLVDSLVSKKEVVVLDNLSSGSIDNLGHSHGHPNLRFIEGSTTSEDDIDDAMAGCSLVFHFAAQPDVRFSSERPLDDFKTNVVGSMNILEAMRKHDVPRILFASSGGTVYGDAPELPTPEHSAFRPISNYGAAKGAVEMYLSSYSELYGLSATSLRFANVVGPRSRHGVIYDFFTKLKHDDSRLEVLGTGNQRKAYISVKDATSAVLLLSAGEKPGFMPVNIASGELVTVSRIAEIVLEEMRLTDAQIEYTGSERGWTGDITRTDLDISLLRSFGWSKTLTAEEGIRTNIRWLIENDKLS
jgi:UDP-glucose 4-epimerase